ncbi:class II aldolase/adducin family protein [Roseomonas sp. NAR14]|uniref:Class II aldolase/adducin family protein n=1 Tax=Roseomonas acroporae TaxID=2937791 RepID=A0A9X2BTY2_9PROT|nr:class II aldolase/adducin family protein [Roseomonas acroporae]MCK8783626.1 class II aldolase/adducin family protein [Roseomonas acroporae]
MLDAAQLNIPSLRDKVSPEEWQARVDTAACYRLIAHYGMADQAANHISMRVPGEPDAFLINAYGMFYEEITASSLIKIDHDGNILLRPETGYDYGVNRAGFVIHSAIHRARPDVDCIIHTHTWAGMAVSCLECGLLPMTQTAMRFAKISYHDYQSVAIDLAEQESLVADLGPHNNAMILRNHGLLTTGSTIPEAFNAMHRLELSCKTQLAAMACNSPLVPVPQQIIDKTYDLYQPGVRRPYGVLEWPALLRMLDRRDPSYRD